MSIGFTPHSLCNSWRLAQKTTTAQNAENMIMAALATTDESTAKGSENSSEKELERLQATDQEICCKSVSPRNDKEALPMISQQYSFLINI